MGEEAAPMTYSLSNRGTNEEASLLVGEASTGNNADSEITSDKLADTETETAQLQHHRPLTWFRMIRGVVILVVLVFTAFVFLIFLAPLTFLFVRLFSVHYSRKATAFIFGHWLAMWPFVFEKVNRTKVIFAGDKVPARERVMVICNHRTEVDWMYLWSLALRNDRIGYVKYVLKSSVRNAPIFGWAFHVLEFLLIDRKWQVDEQVFESVLSTFKGRQDPLWLVLFPEGTDYTEQKWIQSQKFAEEHGLPKLNHLLLPRTKGFFASLSHLRESLDAVYDVTIGYKNGCPLFMDNAFGTAPVEVHIHIQRIPISDIPVPEDEASAWLVEEFGRKDELLTVFYREGSFPNSGIEGELSTFMGITNFCLIVASTCYLSRFFFVSFLWVKVYIALSCVYLTAATYFNYKPLPVLEYLSSRSCL